MWAADEWGSRQGLNGLKTGLWAGMVWKLGRPRSGGWRDDGATFGGRGDPWPRYRGGGNKLGRPFGFKWGQGRGQSRGQIRGVKEDEVFAYIFQGRARGKTQVVPVHN